MVTKHKIGKVSITPKGSYSDSVQYEPLDLVTYNGSSYLSKQAVKNVVPTNSNYWQLMAEKGASGQSLSGLINLYQENGGPDAGYLGYTTSNFANGIIFSDATLSGVLLATEKGLYFGYDNSDDTINKYSGGTTLNADNFPTSIVIGKNSSNIEGIHIKGNVSLSTPLSIANGGTGGNTKALAIHGLGFMWGRIGTNDTGGIPANSAIQFTVTYNTPLEQACAPQISIFTQTLAIDGTCVATLHSWNANGFTVCVYNNSNEDRSPTIFWFVCPSSEESDFSVTRTTYSNTVQSSLRTNVNTLSTKIGDVGNTSLQTQITTLQNQVGSLQNQVNGLLSRISALGG